MAYRTTQVRTIVADDQTLDQIDYDRDATFYQTKDLVVYHGTTRVLPGATQALVPITPIVAGYYGEIRTDYPVLVRFNDIAGTQFRMRTNGATPVNLGFPAPDMCVLTMPADITAVYLQAIPGATQTATVKILVTGDPQNSYV